MRFRNARGIRTGATALALVALVAAVRASAAAPGDAGTARLARDDIAASVREIVAIEDGYAVGFAAYRRAAERARNALLGRGDRDYVADAGEPGDGVGAIGHLDRLLDRRDAPAWTPAVEGAKVNLLAAAQSLTDALGEKQMEDYQTDLTHALADISLALGRPTQAGVLGGLEGALATTALGIPEGARVVAGCDVPRAAPSYGVVAGRLTFVALPAGGSLADALPVRRVRVVDGHIVLYPNDAAETARLCGGSAAASRGDADKAAAPSATVARLERVRRVRRLQPAQSNASPSPAASSATGAAAPSGNAFAYTAAQAKAGAAVYAASCTACHGANLQGVSAPSVAGSDFIKNAQTNGWTMTDLRNIVVQQMPFNNPGSLSPQQYAQVLAFLLASSCFPAGSAPFPTSDDPAFASAKLSAPAGVTPSDAKLGTCAVK